MGEDGTAHAGSAFPPHFSLALNLFRGGRKKIYVKKFVVNSLGYVASSLQKRGQFTDTQYPGVSEDACRLRALPRSGEDWLSGGRASVRERRKQHPVTS